MHKLRVMEAVELHVNATCYAQHPPLKSVYGKNQTVIGGKLFLFYRTVFELKWVFEIRLLMRNPLGILLGGGGEICLSGEGNVRKSDFDNSNRFQS